MTGQLQFGPDHADTATIGWRATRLASNPPPDVVIQRATEAALREGATPPRWGWPIPGPYNGASGAIRVRGWQLIKIAQGLDILGCPEACSVCGRRSSIGLHSELYGRPMLVHEICRSCHFHVHQRFKRPERWKHFLGGCPDGNWVHRLGWEELSRPEANALEQQPDPMGLLSASSCKTVRGAPLPAPE